MRLRLPPRTTVATATDLVRAPKALLTRLASGDAVLITRNNVPVGLLVPASRLHELAEWRERPAA